MTGRATPVYTNATTMRPVQYVREGMARARMTLALLRRIDDWRKLPRAARDLAIASLHVGRQLEADLGFPENAEACLTAIRLLEDLADVDPRREE